MNRTGSVLGRFLPLIVIAAGIGGFVAMGSRPKLDKDSSAGDKTPLVEVVTAEAHQDGLTIEVDGVAAPFREYVITARVAGTIDVKADVAKAGRFVKKGTPLIEIDSRDYALDVKRLNQELKQAESQIKELDVEIANTEELLDLSDQELVLRQKELARISRLLGRDVGTDSELDSAKRNELVAKNSQLTLKSQVRLLTARRERLQHAKELVQTQLDQAELDLKRTEIVAPADGVVVMDHVETGTYVQPGTTLITFEDTSAVEIRCNLTMDELHWLWRQERSENESADAATRDYQFPEADATIIYELAGRRFTWRGQLSRYDGVGLDEKTRTVPCRVLVPNPRAVRLEDSDALVSASPTIIGPPALVRGMFVTVKIHAQPKANLIRLPERAIRPNGEVWLVRDGKLARSGIEIAAVTSAGVLIDADRSDLEPGDQVITTPMSATLRPDGLGYVEEGLPVRIENQRE